MTPALIAGIIAVVVPSITSHEAAHGWVADRLGDPTARERGRLTLNPLPHIDLFFTILLPAFLIFSGSPFIFGGAKPVPVNVARLRNPRRDWALVAAAGPLSNLLIALGLCLALSLLLHAGLLERTSLGTEILGIGVFVNVLLAVFNLVPVPPLDGSRVLQYFLSDTAFLAYRRLERVGLLLVLLLVFYVRPVNILIGRAVFVTLATMTAAFGITDEVMHALAPLLR